jgi:hypothetical protein
MGQQKAGFSPGELVGQISVLRRAGPATPQRASLLVGSFFHLQNGLTAHCVLHKMVERIHLPFAPDGYA